MAMRTRKFSGRIALWRFKSCFITGMMYCIIVLVSTKHAKENTKFLSHFPPFFVVSPSGKNSLYISLCCMCVACVFVLYTFHCVCFIMSEFLTLDSVTDFPLTVQRACVHSLPDTRPPAVWGTAACYHTSCASWCVYQQRSIIQPERLQRTGDVSFSVRSV